MSSGVGTVFSKNKLFFRVCFFVLYSGLIDIYSSGCSFGLFEHWARFLLLIVMLIPDVTLNGLSMHERHSSVAVHIRIACWMSPQQTTLNTCWQANKGAVFQGDELSTYGNSASQTTNYDYSPHLAKQFEPSNKLDLPQNTQTIMIPCLHS